MNKNDMILIVSILIVILLFYCFNTTKSANTATVYHGNEIVLTIDLSKNNTYTVNGDLGEVLIEVKDYKIRVEKENSPYHLCSKQGFIDASSETIVCLPNKIMITMNNREIDTQVK